MVNKIKVLVLGQTGMLGYMVKKVLKTSPRIAVFGTQMHTPGKNGYFNVLDGITGLERIFKTHSGFDYCINCIGLTANKIITKDKASIERARLVNALFPQQLAVLADEYRCKVIHISTDGVFRGTKASYDEFYLPDCKDIYGKTKLAGEINADNFLNIRCSIIGPSPYEHGGLWEWFKGLPKGAQVNGFSNHVWNGVTTLQFAEICRDIILKNRFLHLRSVSKVYHFAPNKPLSKYALLEILQHALKKEVVIKKATQGAGKLSRILRSRFKGFRDLMPYGLTLQQAIHELLVYERKKNG